jgi:putative Mg2+ transporter-C (MgtC) family protein
MEDLRAGLLDVPDVLPLGMRLVLAMLLGAVIGYERESAGKEAGLRTHILVAAGAALLVLVSLGAEMHVGDVSRVIQGIVTGLGFLGAGAILKMDGARTVQGLTTAAGIWLTAALGVAAGLGQYALAILATALGWAVLAWLGMLERRAARKREIVALANSAVGTETPAPGASRTAGPAAADQG